MANANTFNALYNLTGPTSSTETAIAASGSTTVRAILSPRPDIALGLFDGRPFKIRVVSRAVASGACNFTVNLYWNIGTNTNLTTFTSDVLIIGSGAQALASKAGVVFMEATCLWDSGLQNIVAFWNETAGVADIVTSPAIIKSSASLVAAGSGVVASSITSLSSLQFFVTHTMSANATSSTLTEFALDAI